MTWTDYLREGSFIKELERHGKEGICCVQS